jgi:hypothetical protein
VVGVGLGLHLHDAVHRADQADQFAHGLIALGRVDLLVLARPLHLVDDGGLRFFLPVEQEDVFPQRVDLCLGLDAAAVVRLREELDVAHQRFQRHLLPRRRTLHAAMQWSYEQLTPVQQRMMRQVSVFAGGWTLQAAADTPARVGPAVHMPRSLRRVPGLRAAGPGRRAAARRTAQPVAWALGAVGTALEALGRVEDASRVHDEAVELARAPGA